MTIIKRVCGIVLCMALLAGCGYHVAGKGGQMPGGATAVSIPVFVNETSKPNIESVVTGAFVDTFVNTVSITGSAAVVMKGVIKSYVLTPVSYTRSDVNQEYRLTIVMAITLSRGAETLWSAENITNYKDFAVNQADVTATKEAEDKALAKIALDTARLVKENMLSGF
ncbi:MAG: LPS assembly lipoprotein LptE [Deltaproteobacteria bacterium]